MLKHLSLLAVAVASTAAVCNPSTPAPKPPTPVPVATRAVTARTAANLPLASCSITLSVPDRSQTGTSSATGYVAFTVPVDPAPGGLNVQLVASCPGQNAYTWSYVMAATGNQDICLGGSGPCGGGDQVVIGPNFVPTVAPLRGPPTRDQLTHARACFQGLTVTTAQLGAVPSFGGVETGMLSSAADRQTTYASILAAGCNEIVLDVYCHYTEAAVAYPNQTACSNDWTTDNNATLTARVAEAVNAGLNVLLMQGCDELAFPTCASQTAGQWAALRAYAGGDLTQFVALCPGFDGIVPIGNAPPAASSNQALTSLLVNDRAVIGNGVLELELPTGWSFAGDGALSGAGWFTSPGGQAVDVYLQEFANVSPGNGPAPTVVGEFWNAPDSLYSPTWSADASPWDAVWQIAARTVSSYRPSTDQPFNVSVHATDGPQAGSTVQVSDDRQGIKPNTAGGNPRGPFVVVAFELSTYQWTHGQTTTAAVLADCAYVFATGYDAVSCPAVSASALHFAPRR